MEERNVNPNDFVTINNCEGCHKAPCHKIWPAEYSDEAREIIRSGFACINQDMEMSAALEAATLARRLELPFVFEIKQADSDRVGTFDFWIPNRYVNTEPHKLVNILMITQAVQTGIDRANDRATRETSINLANADLFKSEADFRKWLSGGK